MQEYEIVSRMQFKTESLKLNSIFRELTHITKHTCNKHAHAHAHTHNHTHKPPNPTTIRHQRKQTITGYPKRIKQHVPLQRIISNINSSLSNRSYLSKLMVWLYSPSPSKIQYFDQNQSYCTGAVSARMDTPETITAVVLFHAQT